MPVRHLAYHYTPLPSVTQSPRLMVPSHGLPLALTGGVGGHKYPALSGATRAPSCQLVDGRCEA